MHLEISFMLKLFEHELHLFKDVKESKLCMHWAELYGGCTIHSTKDKMFLLHLLTGPRHQKKSIRRYH